MRVIAPAVNQNRNRYLCMSADTQALSVATPPPGPALAPDQAHAIVQDWLNIQCGMLNGVARALVLQVGSDDQPAQSLARWPAGIDSSDDLTEYGLAAAQEQQCSVERVAGEPPRDRIAFPISLPAGASLVLTLEMSGRPEIQQQAVVNLLRWGAQWLKFALQRQAPVSADRLLPVFQMLVACVDEASFKAMATRLVAELAARYRCNRVSLGVRRGRHVAVQALSHSARFKQQNNIIRTIATAMDEAIDQDCSLRLPPAGAQPPRITRAHAELSRSNGNAAVCTLPLNAHGEVFGALTMERDACEPFDQASEQQVEQLLAVLAAPLRVKYQDEKSLPAKVLASIGAFAARLFGPAHLTLKFATLVLAAALTFLAVTPGNYRVATEANIEGSIQRVVAAPVQGFIAAANVQAGDIVQVGDEMGRLDDKDLRLERLKWSSQRQQYAREYREAMATHDRTQVSIVGAQIKQADAQLKLVDEQLARTQIIAPFAGVVIEGDLSQSLGAPVERGDVLFKVAPLEDFRIQLQVDEQDIAVVKPGQQGWLALTSLPGERIAMTVKKITSVSTAANGKNFFRVEAELQDQTTPLRPGMAGIAKIDIGERKLLWIWTHGLIDWLRLQAWRWLP